MQDERSTDVYSPTENANASSAASDVCALSSVPSTTDEASVTSGFYTIHSGVRSETSGVYTEDVNTEDQEPIYSVCKGDERTQDAASAVGEPLLDPELEDPRSRSNSILSAGSFRGDGSDPSDVGPLLSADELSDLIVGRYPPRKTISNSMDSDCDYVTLPPPPPPPRTDSDRQLPPPPPYPTGADYATIKSPRSEASVEREPPPPPPYNALRRDFVPLPPRRSEPPPPPPYTAPRERIQIPPPTPPRNDAVTPREPPPPPPYPELPEHQNAGADGTTNIFEKKKTEEVNVAKNSTGKHYSPSTNSSTNFSPAGNSAPKPPPRIQPPTYPGDKMKPTPVHAPVAALVVGPNNYLDVHASRGGPVLLPYLAPPPPPATHPRQPPPPPPSLATVYTSQVTRSQIEQYKQQLYSDVDFVMFPLKDPAVSKQEYIDAKQGSLIAAMAAYPPPPYPTFNSKSSVVYRSTPYLPGSSFSSPSKYASNQNLSAADSSAGGFLLHSNISSHYAASTSSLYSGATCSSGGSHSLRREPPAPAHPHTLHGFSRTKSDDNILKSFDASINTRVQSVAQPKHRRLPPPPPPPPYEIQVSSFKDFSSSLLHFMIFRIVIVRVMLHCFLFFQTLEKSQPLPSTSSTKINSGVSATQLGSRDDGKEDGMLDIRTLREKSRNLDLPLISALCNDRYLLKQTKAFVLPKHPTEAAVVSSAKTSSRSNGGTSSRNKYPVSGLSTTQITKPPRKPSTSTHRHPGESKGNAYRLLATPGPSPAKKDPTRASHS